MAVPLPRSNGRSTQKRTPAPATALTVPMDKTGKKKKGKTTTASDNEPETFTIGTRDKKEEHGNLPPPCFRVETVDSGYKVRLDYYDRTGTRRRPYCCYLTAKEGEKLRGKYFEDAAPVIMKRVKERRPKTDAERQKVEVLIDTLERLTSP